MKTRFLRTAQATLIVLAGIWVFWPALRGSWVWDDAAEIVRNPILRDPRGLWKGWVAPAGSDYFPLKTTVQWIEWRLWGEEAMGYHATSLALHELSALLFWWLLVKLRGMRMGGAEAKSVGGAEGGEGLEWLGGLLFVVHPLAVESVAWVAELKNTLSLPFLLVAMIGYVDYERTGRRGSYALSVACFILAMLAKSSVVMFPCVIVLYGWWRGRKIGWRELKETVPFFAVALVLGLVTVWFQEERAIEGADLAIGGIGSRLAGAGMAVGFYLEKFFMPIGLMPVYPRWSVVPPSPEQFVPWLALSGLVAWLWSRRTGWGRDALLGLGFFGLNLAPVVGWVPMAYLRISWVADHLVYVPMLGLIGVVVGGVGALADWAARTRPGLLFPLGGAAAIVLGALGLASRQYAAIYRGDLAFWSYAVRENPKAWLAQNDLGLVLTDAGRAPEAIEHLQSALRLRPDYAEAHNNLGKALALTGRLPEALGQFVEALRLAPNNVEARDNLGSVFIQSGRFGEAIDQYRVLRLKPDLGEAHASLGYALAAAGRLPEAILQYRESLRLQPDDPRLHNALGIALAKAGLLTEAAAEFHESLRIRPDLAETHYDLGLALRMADRPDEAEIEFREAARLRAGAPDRR